jgi:hypothetical protein
MVARLRFILILISLFAHLPAFAAAKEGGSDGGHSGGGGTFIRCEFPNLKRPQYFFWDLHAECPKHPGSERRGDRIRLSAEGEKAGGEWIDARKLKSYKYLEKQLKAWERWAPNFTKLMKEGLKQEINFIATHYSIQSVKEIQVPPGFDRERAVPGAYFEYGSQRLFVDLKVWNDAGLESQAAMLLHELLRREQERFQLKNATIQRTVRRVITRSGNWSTADMLRETFLFCDLIEDSAFESGRAKGERGESMPQESAKESAGEAIAEAVKDGILGRMELAVKPRSGGRFSEKPRKPDPRHELEVMGACLDARPDEDF